MILPNSLAAAHASSRKWLSASRNTAAIADTQPEANATRIGPFEIKTPARSSVMQLLELAAAWGRAGQTNRLTDEQVLALP